MRTLIAKTPHHAQALSQLAKLLHQKNFCDIIEIERQVGRGVNTVDPAAFDAAWSVLESVRPDPRYKYPNLADALNFATVVGLRSIKENEEFKYFPFLLTNTRPLLDEKNWARDPIVQNTGLDVTVSRRPIIAVYSHIASQLEQDPSNAADHTAKLIHQIGVVELDLRLSHGYRTKVPELRNYEWEEMITIGQLAPSLEKQIKSLSGFAMDPLISESQRIYDNIQQNIASWRKLQELPSDVQSPRKLFDIIIGVSQAVYESVSSHQALNLIWNKVISTRPYEGISFVTKRYRDISNPDQSYIEIEKHNEGYFILRWPTNLTIDQLLNVFSLAFARHGCEEVVLHIGTTEEMVTFDVTFPLYLKEVLSEVSSPILWLRMDGQEFDLYADILTDANVTPQIGLLVSKPHRDHIAEFYTATSARFIFRSWLMKICDDAGIPAE